MTVIFVIEKNKKCAKNSLLKRKKNLLIRDACIFNISKEMKKT